MAQPQTTTEKRFIKALDDYCGLLKDQEHIGNVNQETLDRIFVWYTTDELSGIISKLSNIMFEMAEVLILAKDGAIRPNWSRELKFVANDMTRFSEIISETYRLRFH